MKSTVNFYDFERAFVNMDRTDSFSYNGKKALFEYLEDYEEGTGEEIELDIIAICCEYSEFETALEAAIEYGFETPATWLATRDEDEAQEAAIEWLQDQTSVIRVGQYGIIIQGF